jgi:hypothetical protein
MKPIVPHLVGESYSQVDLTSEVKLYLITEAMMFQHTSWANHTHFPLRHATAWLRTRRPKT